MPNARVTWRVQSGSVLRGAAEQFARATLAGQAASVRPWGELLTAVKSLGDGVRAELEGQAAADLEMYPSKERKRVRTEWDDRTKRARRRVETSALDLELQLVALWFADLAYLAWGAEDLIRNVDRAAELNEDADGGPEARRSESGDRAR